MKPIADGLDIIQSDNNMYIGYLFPVILSIKNELETVKIKYCKPLVTSLLQGILTRFIYKIYLYFKFKKIK